MFGAMYIGLSGMTAYSDGLRQVSNNITNLNTEGYKAADIEFSDLFRSGSNSLSFVGDGDANGGGVFLSDPRLDLAQGELRQSERDLDLAMDGSGFLVLRRGEDLFFTRTGRFEVSNDGYVVLTGTDYRLAALSEGGEPVDLTIDGNRINPPQATTKIVFADNLSSTASGHSIADVTVYAPDGEADTWSIAFSREETDPAGEWKVTVTNSEGDEIDEQILKFINGLPDPSSHQLIFADEKGRSVELDFSTNVTSFSSGEVSTLRTEEVDGFGVGEVTTVRVNEDGEFEVSYSNEQTEILGAVAIADFRAPQTLQQRTGGLFVDAADSGRDYYTSSDDRVGRVLSNRTEASNVDLSAQFGDLILVQRGYQASSQIVSATNDMIQQLFGIRGQG